MKSLDFTLDKYKDLCNALIKSGYTTVPFRDYLVMEPSEEKIAILRHDVDRKIGNALRMYSLERDLGIRSTYYFRYPYTFTPGIIKEIQSMGHDIGYNYETLSKAKGDPKLALGSSRRSLMSSRRSIARSPRSACMEAPSLLSTIWISGMCVM